jgi:hypothetical protein
VPGLDTSGFNPSTLDFTLLWLRSILTLLLAILCNNSISPESFSRCIDGKLLVTRLIAKYQVSTTSTNYDWVRRIEWGAMLWEIALAQRTGMG